MFYDYNNDNITYIGRWGIDNAGVLVNDGMTSTANGSKITFKFEGNFAILHFNMFHCIAPYPHIWIIVDGNVKTEAALDRFIRIETAKPGIHTLDIVTKSSCEMYSRWHSPLGAKVTFLGVEAEKILKNETKKKTIEFIGDSITEGILIDVDKLADDESHEFRPLQDDSMATYAYLTATALDLEPYIMAYGAVGLTRAGCGGVPKCIDAYKFCFDKVEKSYHNCDYILINHGTNDRGKSITEYLDEYERFLNMIAEENPNSKIIVLSPFCGYAHEELGEFVTRYNEKYLKKVYYIDSNGWVPEEPIHPLREGHIIVANNLIEKMKKIVEV